MKKQEETARIEAEKEFILEQIEPRQSHIDKRILFETTGRRLNEADYQDESQSEGDVDVILDDMLGYDPRYTMPEGDVNRNGTTFTAINLENDDDKDSGDNEKESGSNLQKRLIEKGKDDIAD